MKAPAHMGSLRSLTRHVPEALIVQLHRDPATCVSSVCSLVSTFHQGVSDDIDILRMSDLVLQLYETWLRRNLAFREANSDSICDVYFDSLVSDPIQTVRGVYAYFDLQWNDSIVSKLKKYIDKNPKQKHGKHHYSASDFGLNEAGIAERLKFYYGEYISL